MIVSLHGSATAEPCRLAKRAHHGALLGAQCSGIDS